jgi:hypothetical protein
VIGSVVTLGFAPGSVGLSRVPTIGYSLGGAGPVASVTSLLGTDELPDIDRVSEWRKHREDEMVLGVIRKFLSTQ